MKKCILWTLLSLGSSASNAWDFAESIVGAAIRAAVKP
jgi:hypothetical protein